MGAPEAPTRVRLESIDLVRGIVMVVMVLDHTRDYIHSGGIRFDPTDLTQTTTALFLTRWVTHFCAPAFVFLAGVGAYLQTMRGKSTRELSAFLLTRGLWLVVLELTVVRVAMWFNVDYSFLAVLQVIWAIGISMVVLAALVHLPLSAVGAFGVAMILVHNAFDWIQVPGWQGPGAPVPDGPAKLWMLLHQAEEFFPMFGAGSPVVFVQYPLIPWVGVMAAGYAFGRVYTLAGAARRRVLLLTGTLLVVTFVVLRAGNIYGDPHGWAVQGSSLFTLLSFMNVTKYPVSLQFLLVTLGPTLLALAWLEQSPRRRLDRAFITFGRVPLFFYLLQWPAAHACAVLITYMVGKDARYFFADPPAAFEKAPGNAGFDLWVVYVCWITIVLALYPLCRWFAEVKRRRRDW